MRNPGRLFGAVLTVIAAASVGACAAPPASSGSQPTRSASPTTPMASVDDLLGIDWLMTSATADGRPRPLPPPARELSIRFGEDGTAGGRDGCNWFGGDATIDADTVVLAPGMTTDMLCTGESDLTDIYPRSLYDGATWRIEDDHLTLTASSGEVFEFVPWPSEFLSDRLGDPVVTIAEGTLGYSDYRVILDRVDEFSLCTQLEFRNPAGTKPDGNGACRSVDTAAAHVVNPTDFSSWTHADIGVIVGAVPPDTATRIEVQPVHGTPIELTLTPIPGHDYLAFHGFVPNPTRGDKVVFYDAAGAVIEPSWEPYW